MALVEPGSDEEKDIDVSLSVWRQGDCALDETWFAHVADGSRALTGECAQGGNEVHVAEYGGMEGLVVVTQTCDVVRNCLKRPFVEVAPLVTVLVDDYRLIERGYRPNYAAIPALSDRHLVAHLDRTLTVEKSVVANWERTPGCRTDEEARDFARALARKRERPAFPDDFVALLKRFAERLRRRHDRDDTEGEALQALREIRVRASPDWSAEQVRVTFWFVPEVGAAGRPDADQISRWIGLVDRSERFQPVEGLILSLDDMTAREYVESDRLDLDHLSTRREE